MEVRMQVLMTRMQRFRLRAPEEQRASQHRGGDAERVVARLGRHVLLHQLRQRRRSRMCQPPH